MQKIALNNLTLTDYRNFHNFRLQFDNPLVLITGQNGSGKTNILESISYLAPGKGIRSAAFDQLCRNHNHPWQSYIAFESKLGLAEVTAHFDGMTKRRKIQYNGSKITSNELSRLANIVWLTPQMSGLFIGSRLDRRRFLDRMVANFEKDHATNLTNLDKLISQRLNALKENIGNFDEALLTVLEAKIADYALAVHQGRVKALKYLQKAIDELESDFPKAELALTVFDPDITEDNFKEKYKLEQKNSRQKDAYSGRTNYGVQRIDLAVRHRGKGAMAEICSTGEQKAMLISIFIAQINAITEQARATPLVLLDELFVHLDEFRKQLLEDYVINSGAGCLITATDSYGIEAIAKQAQRIEL